MASNNVASKRKFKTFCLLRKLKHLERKRANEIANFIASHPQQAAKMDDIERNINSQALNEVAFKISAINRLLRRFESN